MNFLQAYEALNTIAKDSTKLNESNIIQDSPMVGEYVQIVQSSPKYRAAGSPIQLAELKSLLRGCTGCRLSPTEINFIAKFDNKCKIIQETDKAYLVKIPCYYRDKQDRSKFQERPRHVTCWVPKIAARPVEADLSET